MVDQAILDVIEGRLDCCVFDQGHPVDGTPGKNVFPGSFNPLHEGHTGMMQYVARVQNTPVDFELSIANVDKDKISLDEIKWRLSQFSAERICITRAATFGEKSELFPGRNFIVGADTAVRLFDLKYYDSPQRLIQTFDRIHDLGCRFLVFGRKMETDFEDAASIPIPDRHRHLFTPISEEDFRVDISSRELRSKGTE